MNAKRLVYMSVFISLMGLIGLIFSLSRPESTVEEQHAIKTYEVLVTTQAITMGKRYSASLFEWKTVPEESITNRVDFINKADFSLAQLANTVAADDLVAGQILSPSDFLLPEQGGFLSVMLRPEYRAVSMPVKQVTANSGLIAPGDYVDVLLLASKSQELRSRGNETQSLYVKTIVENVRVLSFNDAVQIDRYLETQQQTNGFMPDNSTVTLEVLPLQANKITLANQLGTLSIVLRSKNSSASDMGTQSSVSVGDILPAIKLIQPDIGLVEFRAKEKRVMNNAGTQND